MEKLLTSIKDQSYTEIEIIAVDNFSSDRTYPLLKKYTRNVFRHGPERSAQRNFGADKAKGKYLLIPDSDMILTKDVIRGCVAAAENNARVKAVVIPEKSFGTGFWAACKTLERKCYENDQSIEAARFFERKTFHSIGGYDEKITGPEDWDLPQRIRSKGFVIGRIKEYILHDEGNLRLFTVVRKKYYYGLKLDAYLRKHPFRNNLSQTIYFLRPAFYRNWSLLLSHPFTTSGMFIMLFCEQVAGFAGFIKGRNQV
ncbi:MAG: glycosyltransferase [bacterium]|nr:glycosyltransferase [bacterium]